MGWAGHLLNLMDGAYWVTAQCPNCRLPTKSLNGAGPQYVLSRRSSYRHGFLRARLARTRPCLEMEAAAAAAAACVVASWSLRWILQPIPTNASSWPRHPLIKNQQHDFSDTHTNGLRRPLSFGWSNAGWRWEGMQSIRSPSGLCKKMQWLHNPRWLNWEREGDRKENNALIVLTAGLLSLLRWALMILLCA